MTVESIVGFIAFIGFFVKIPIHVYLLKTNTKKDYDWGGYDSAGPSDKYLFFLPVIIPVSKKQLPLKVLANTLYWFFVLFIAVAIIRTL